MTQGKKASVAIKQPVHMWLALEVTGTSDLIQNNFCQKAIEEMLRKHMGLTVQRDKKVPREALEDATIYNQDGRVCIPPTAFKKAMLSAASGIKSLKKTELRAQLFVVGGSIPITYDKCVPRMDMVRNSGIGRTPDVRFRPAFQGWKARIMIRFNSELAAQTVVDLLNRAGQMGVGEWRPERDGMYGTFVVTDSITKPKLVAQIEKECASPLVPITIPDWALDAELSEGEVIELVDDIKKNKGKAKKKGGAGKGKAA